MDQDGEAQDGHWMSAIYVNTIVAKKKAARKKLAEFQETIKTRMVAFIKKAFTLYQQMPLLSSPTFIMC